MQGITKNTFPHLWVLAIRCSMERQAGANYGNMLGSSLGIIDRPNQEIK